MDPLFKRFERILRSYFQNGSPTAEWERWEFTEDQDFRDAHEELDEFLKTGRSHESWREGSSAFGGNTPGNERWSERNSHRGNSEPPPPELLRADYRELEVRFGSSFKEVRNAYRQLMRAHHPDRHTSNPEMQGRANRKAQQLNISFHRIRAWEEAKKGG